MCTKKLLVYLRGLVLLAALFMVVAADAAVATTRLSTGLGPSSAGNGLPQAWAAPLTQAPAKDAWPDAKAWEATRPITLGRLERHGEASPRTEVRFLRTNSTLYLRANLAEPNMAGLKRAVTQRDGPVYADDSLELFLAPSAGDGYYQLVLGAGGAVYDRTNHDDASAWDSKTRTAVTLSKDDWTLDAAIPMASLGVGEQGPTRWGVNVYRNRRAGGKGELQAWSPTLSEDYDVPERFGYLLFTPEPPWGKADKPAAKPSGIVVHKLGEDEAVLLFDLTSLPKGTRVYRASLQCERRSLEPGDPRALIDIEIYPLAAPYQEGVAPKSEGKALVLAPPWYRAFDMTALVQSRLSAGKTECGVHIKKFPAWRIEKTVLDLTYEGQPADVPRQASQVKALHRAGQTFLSWKEIDEPVGKDEVTWGELKAVIEGLDNRGQVRYCVYRSEQPITRDTLASAELLATVKPLSCWNTNGRNFERPIDIAISTKDYITCGQWNPFNSASVDGDFGRDCPMERLVIKDGETPLDRGTGLYVHTPPAKGKAYYAVLTMLDGVANTSEFSAGNVTGAIEETPAEPLPVLQREMPKMPFFNYADKRLHYVQWVAGPKMANVPCQHYNWSVGVPESVLAASDKTTRVPLELTLHRDGHSYWRTQFRMERNGIVLAPHDFPIRSWWYGYHEALDTLKSYRQGAIHPYTERRLLAFVDWAAKKWPVDPGKIIVSGSRGGASASGALHLGLRYPEVFALVISGHGSPTYADLATSTDRRGPSDAAKTLQTIFGHPDWALKTDTGKNVWEELDMNRHLAETPQKADLPLVTITSSNKGPIQEFHRLMLQQGRPLIAEFWWGGGRYIPVTASETFPNAVRLDIRRNLSLLAFNSEAAQKTLAGGMGEFNREFTWAAPVEAPGKYEVMISTSGKQNPAAGKARLFDITLRQLQKFQVGSGKSYRWSVASADGQTPEIRPAKKSRSAKEEPAQPTEGEASASKEGVLTLKGVPLGGEVKLTVTMK